MEKTDIPVYVAMIPTAAEIWRDQLPEGAESMDQWAYLEQVKETGAIYVDVGGLLAEHSDEAIFYRTDHHWTSLGAYYGYAALMEALGVNPGGTGGEDHRVHGLQRHPLLHLRRPLAHPRRD